MEYFKDKTVTRDASALAGDAINLIGRGSKEINPDIQNETSNTPDDAPGPQKKPLGSKATTTSASARRAYMGLLRRTKYL